MFQTDSIRIDEAYRDALAATGLARVDDVLARSDGRIAAWSRTTDTVLVPGSNGAPGFYVKRNYYSSWRRRLRGSFRGTFFGMHRGHAEYRLLNEMRRLGLPAVRPVAHGTRRVGHFVAASFLITEEVPGAQNLTMFARDVATGRKEISDRRRARLVRVLAREVARVHMTGYAHGQLFWRNVLLRFGPGDEPEFYFLDMRPRHAGRHLGRAPRWWVGELAQMSASALPFTTGAERLRFLSEYFSIRNARLDVREVANDINRMARRWEDHERQRIKMSDLFDTWNRELDAEDARFGAPAVAQPALQEAWR